MGIENAAQCCRVRVRQRPRVSHYPSWGSKTLRSGTQHCDAKQYKLITPHGDRKRGAMTLVRSRQRLLITPHGDRKRSGCRPVAATPRATALITPHGDRKLGGRSLISLRISLDLSLPLMGIENHLAGTWHDLAVNPELSLPLMGIENSSQPSTGAGAGPTSHYPSWGSKTSDGTILHRRSDLPEDLITPHGDRKRAVTRLRSRAALIRSHYPSWGSKTSAACHPLRSWSR